MNLVNTARLLSITSTYAKTKALNACEIYNPYGGTLGMICASLFMLNGFNQYQNDHNLKKPTFEKWRNTAIVTSGSICVGFALGYAAPITVPYMLNHMFKGTPISDFPNTNA